MAGRSQTCPGQLRTTRSTSSRAPLPGVAIVPGGLEGGMSTGQTIRVRGAMKPLSTLMRPLDTVDVITKEPALAIRERSDVCAVPAAAVVGEQVVAWVLAVELMRMLGGDTISAVRLAADAYRARLAGF